MVVGVIFFFFFSSRRRHTRYWRDWSSDVCSSDLSDVRANTTTARPLNGGGPGAEYEVTGHKWFFSAPMCDAFLVLAQAEGGVSCFLMPRFTPDGGRNRIHLQRLKDKLGNRSNAS